MGASALWTSDGTSYVFTESTNINPEAGNINEKNGSNLTPLKKQPAQSGPTLMAAMMSASLCNNSSIVKDLDTSEWKAIGDPTEVFFILY
jgi:Ca2+-transporting ATPase